MASIEQNSNVNLYNSYWLLTLLWRHPYVFILNLSICHCNIHILYIAVIDVNTEVETVEPL